MFHLNEAFVFFSFSFSRPRWLDAKVKEAILCGKQQAYCIARRPPMEYPTRWNFSKDGIHFVKSNVKGVFPWPGKLTAIQWQFGKIEQTDSQSKGEPKNP